MSNIVISSSEDAVSGYLKVQVTETTASNNFSSNTPTNVPGLTYTITVDGDYVLYSIINGQCDQNEEIELYFAKNGTTDLDSVCIDRWSKNREQSVQSTYALDGLVVGDVITVQLNTNNDDVDLENRRLLLQTWG